MTGETYTLILPMLPMSMNQRERAHRYARSTELKQIQQLVKAKGRHIPKAVGRRSVRIDIVKYSRGGRDDPANRASRAKSPLDAMVKCGLLIDDSDEWLEWLQVHESKGAKLKNDQHCVITICDL